MMRTRCMVVDDEPLAIEVLAAHVARVDTLELVSRCASADEAFTALQRGDVDLLFLDIEMPGLSGIGLLRSLRHPPAVIITTAHRDYAVEGFELDVTDYLLKPVSFERFLRSVEKYHGQRPRREAAVPVREAWGERFLLLRADRKTHKVPYDAILYAESLKDYVRVRTKEGSVTARLAMNALEELLPADRFLRIHRGCIVALAHIDAFTSHSVEIGSHELTIGRNYRSAVLRALHADPDLP
jgi:DNA-binding LytR/AlgR family response regulator